MFFTILVVIPSRYILALYNVSLARPVDMNTCLLSGSYDRFFALPTPKSKVKTICKLTFTVYLWNVSLQTST